MTTANAPDQSPATRSRLRSLGPWAVVAALILGTLTLALPRLIQHLAVPAMATALNAPGLALDVRRADLSGLDLGDISLAPKGDTLASAVLVDWSLAGLIRGRIDRIQILGLDLRLVEQDGQWTIPGIPRPARQTESSSPSSFLPTIGELRIDGRVAVNATNLVLSAPLAVRGSLNQGRLAVDTRTALAGQNVNLELETEHGLDSFKLTCRLPPASLSALASMIPGLADLPLGGLVQARVDASLSPNEHPQVEAELGLSDVRAMLGDSRLAAPGETNLRLVWRDTLRIDLAPVRLAAPLALILNVSEIKADLTGGNLACAWEVESGPVPGFDFSSTPRLAGRLQAARAEHGWTLHAAADLGPIQASLSAAPNVRIQLDSGRLAVDASIDAANTRLQGDLRLGRLRMSQDAIRLDLAGLIIGGNATTGVAGLDGALRLSAGLLDVRLPGMSASSTRIEADGRFALGQDPTVNATLLVGARATAGQVTASVNARLPLAWPKPSAIPGAFNLDLNQGRISLARIATRIMHDPRGLDVDGTLTTPVLGVRAPLKGRIDFSRPEQSWVNVTAGQAVDLPAGLPRLIPALAGLSGSGRLDLRARLDLSRGVPVLPVSVAVDNLSLAHAASKTTLSGGSVGLSFADLLSLRSEPDQRLAFERLQLGSVILDQGDIRYQVEAAHSILVEACSFRWAGGRIGSRAFRINPNVEDYTVELYCDRVELSKALEQFGMTQAQGGGTANGRIPVRWSGGSLTFDNGFLYSTPGESGVLKIQGTEILTAGIPPGTPQYGQLDLAAEALKDFAYDWAKITMNTQGQELLVSLQLDGKPAKPLPFSYDRSFGGFARVSASSPGSVFQGIRLDVNFRLPLDQLLQYRQLLELMQQGG